MNHHLLSKLQIKKDCKAGYCHEIMDSAGSPQFQSQIHNEIGSDGVGRLAEMLNFGLQILHELEAKTSFCNAHGQIRIKSG